MSQVNYRFYTDKDAEGVLELFRRNRYYLGRRPVSVDQFRQSLIDRGTYFAVIGEDDEKIIAYMAAYPTGDGKVCRKHQILVGGLLVDDQYRGKLYSISTIYVMTVLRIVEMGSFTTIIGEVESYRKQSLLMHRYFGSVMVNGVVKHDPEVNQMYNFIPGYFLLFDESSESRKCKMTSLLPKADKRCYDKEDEIIDSEYVNTYTELSYGRVRLLDHIHTGIVDEVEMEKFGLFLGVSRDRRTFVISRTVPKGAAGVISLISIQLYGNEGVIEETDVDVSHACQTEISVKDGVDRIHVAVNGIKDGFWFYPTRPVEIKTSKKKNLWGLSGHTLDLATGYFTVNTLSQNGLVELWPFMKPPYLIGDIEPDYELSIEEDDSSEKGSPDTAYRFIRKQDNNAVIRDYCKDGNDITIRTVVESENPGLLRPKFQFLIRDVKAKIIFLNYKESDGRKSLTFKTEMYVDEARDLKIASKEIPFARFADEPYSRALLQKIIIETDEHSYNIETSKRARAYLQFNYIGIDYDMSDIPYTDGRYDFGTVRISVADYKH